MNKHVFWYIIVCLFPFRFIFANNNIIVEHFSTEDGIPHETVHCALKSSDGFCGLVHGMAYAVLMV